MAGPFPSIRVISSRNSILLPFFVRTTHLNELDAHAIGGGDIAQDHPGFEFPWLHRHTHAFSFQFRAERPQVSAIGEPEVIGSPLIVTGVPVELVDGFGLGGMFPGPLASDDAFGSRLIKWMWSNAISWSINLLIPSVLSAEQ